PDPARYSPATWSRSRWTGSAGWPTGWWPDRCPSAKTSAPNRPSPRRSAPPPWVATGSTAASATGPHPALLLQVQAGEDHDAGVGEVGHRAGDTFAAVAGVLGAAVGHLLGAEAGYVADDDATDGQVAVGAERGGEVAGEYSGL